MSQGPHEHDKFVRIVKEIDMATGVHEYIEWICTHCGKVYFRIEITNSN